MSKRSNMFLDPMEALKSLIARIVTDPDERIEIQSALCQVTRELIANRKKILECAGKEEAYREILVLLLDK